MPNYWKIDPIYTGYSWVSECLVRVYVKQSLCCGYRPDAAGVLITKCVTFIIALQMNMHPRKRFDFKCAIDGMGKVIKETMVMRHYAPASVQ